MDKMKFILWGVYCNSCGSCLSWPTTSNFRKNMYASGCRSDNVDQFTKLIGIVATMNWRLHGL